MSLVDQSRAVQAPGFPCLHAASSWWQWRIGASCSVSNKSPLGSKSGGHFPGLRAWADETASVATAARSKVLSILVFLRIWQIGCPARALSGGLNGGGDDATDCHGHGGEFVVGQINCRHWLTPPPSQDNHAPRAPANNPRRHLGGLQHPSSGLCNDVSLFLKVLHLLDPRHDG